MLANEEESIHVPEQLEKRFCQVRRPVIFDQMLANRIDSAGHFGPRGIQQMVAQPMHPRGKFGDRVGAIRIAVAIYSIVDQEAKSVVLPTVLAQGLHIRLGLRFSVEKATDQPPPPARAGPARSLLYRDSS